MNRIKDAFDRALKISKGGNVNEGYVFDDGRVDYSYFTREQWDAFLNEMKSMHSKAFQEFTNGDGAELVERKSVSGKLIPPKMASYASSSRLIFELSRKMGDDFIFEYKLPIAFRGYKEEAKASLDGFIPSKRIFVEAKCHEIYSSPSTEYKRAYNGFYQYLREGTKGKFDYFTTSSTKKEYVHFKWEGRCLTTFDLKQALCHMLGIAKKALLEDCSETSTLIYLLYRPEKDLLEMIHDEEIRKEINDIWTKEKAEADMIDFKLLYELIVKYIFAEKKNWQKNGHYSSRIDEISNAFVFKFCDQNEYAAILNYINLSGNHKHIV